MTQVVQVPPLTHWPSGDSRPIAVLSLEPEDLAARWDLDFETAEDELGPYRLAAVEVFPDHQVWLLRHRYNPANGTEVYADANEPVLPLLARLLHILELDEANVTWSVEPHARFFHPGQMTSESLQSRRSPLVELAVASDAVVAQRGDAYYLVAPDGGTVLWHDTESLFFGVPIADAVARLVMGIGRDSESASADSERALHRFIAFDLVLNWVYEMATAHPAEARELLRDMSRRRGTDTEHDAGEDEHFDEGAFFEELRKAIREGDSSSKPSGSELRNRKT